MRDSFYDSKKWDHLRGSILRRDGYKCQYFARFGKQRQANTVHHVFPRREFPQYQYAPWNLVSLSKEAHDMMHIRQSDDLTETGKELLRRVARKNGAEIPEKYK